MIPAKRCRHCGALIRIVEVGPGEWVPVDARPSRLNGRITLLAQGRAERLDRAEATRRRDDGEDLHASHFESCPGARAARTERAIEARRPREAPDAVRAARAAFALQQRRKAETRQERLFR